MAADSNKDLHIGKNNIKKVEMIQTTTYDLIIWQLSFFVDEDVQAALWLHALFITM